MKELLITDLDGTLLNSNGKLSDITSEIINQYISAGGAFTFATARTASSAVKITEKININAPCVLMNGVSIYDMQKKKYIKNEYINNDAAVAVANTFYQCNVKPFMYKIKNNQLFALYIGFENKQMYEFFLLRRDKYDKPFIKCSDFACEADENVVYFTTLGKYESLAPVKNRLDKIDDISTAFYKDVYNKGLWFLEVFSNRASKSNGVNFLKKFGKFDYVTCFGDNLNDLPMFRICDKRIAVGNAKEEVKSAADEVIDCNDTDSVAFWIKKNYMKGFE
ncbi:MAG: HAD family hydrolase [Oscillospiraceae bacterium]|nr:HAD family hydrolase [Oscillospiraceae bacterium]